MPPLRSLALLLLSALPAAALDLYVSPQGRDEWSGTRADATATDGPFATLTRARDRVRELRPKLAEPVTIHLRAGLYALPETFTLEARDAGTERAPVTWRGYRKERPVLTAGRALTGWQPFKDGILQTSLPGPAVHQLLLEGRRQPLARYPNFDAANPYAGGWAYAGGDYWPMYEAKPGENSHTLQVKPQDWRTWAHPEEVELFVFPRFNWWNDLLHVKATDAAAHTLTTTADASYAMRANDRYFVQNALEELDAPGEWYHDAKASQLYFKPPGPLEGKTVLVPRPGPIVELNKTAWITFEGIEFTCSEETALRLRDSEHCTVAASTIHDVGGFNGNAVSIEGGRENGLAGCDIWNTGRNGVTLTGGDSPTLTAAGHFVDNCYLHHLGVLYKQGAAVVIEGVGMRVSHCLIHDTPRFAILFAGQNHVLEYNHMRHLALETEDVGATYCRGVDWITSRGTVIRYNFIHDVLGFGWNGKWTSPYFAWGIYLDDNTAGVDVIGNIVARCGRSLLHGHNARDCKVENNIFLEGGQRQWEFNGWKADNRMWLEKVGEMTKGYEAVKSQPAWAKVRGLEPGPAQAADAQGWTMSGNEFHRNIMAWHDPKAAALHVDRFNPERNHFDGNLYWHYGQPLLTGFRLPGQPVSGNLLVNPELQGQNGQLPRDWSFQMQPPGARAYLEEGTLFIKGALDPSKDANANFTCVVGKDVELVPGRSYRLAVKLRTNQPGAKANFMLQFYLSGTKEKPGHFWASGPNEAALTEEWKDYEFGFTFPAEGQPGYHPAMKAVRPRLDWKVAGGTLFVHSPSLQETREKNEWASWQEAGGETHSVVADPLFTAPEKDDYRLKKGSPALALGFQPIPVEKIGPHADPRRASWPIVEAEGAREHPLTP